MRSRFHLLSEEEVQKLHGETLLALARTGIAIPNGEAKEALVRAGAAEEGGRLLFPADMVERCFALPRKAPVLAAKGKERQLLWEGGPALNTNCGFTSQVVDFRSGRYRPVDVLDLLDLCRLINGLPAADYLSLPCLEGPEGDVEGLRIALKYSRKHVLTRCGDGAAAKAQLGLLKRSEGEPRFSALVPAASPLALAAADALWHFAQNRVTAGLLYPMPLWPGSADLGRLLLLANAQNIAAFVLAKIADPDAPFLYCGYQSFLPAPLGLAGEENLALYLLRAGQSQLAAFYRLPSLVFSGLTAERCFGNRQGFEKNLRQQALLQMVAGASFLWLGAVDLGRAYGLTDIVLDAEVSAMAKAYTRAFVADDDTLATAVVEDVGPGGHFLFHDHTLSHFKEEIWLKKPEDSFLFAPDRDYMELATEKVRKLLSV